MIFKYADLNTAALGVLAEVANIVSSVGQPYVVIGGWSPFLLNAKPIPHPGTHDVDLLFKHGATIGELKEVISSLLARGFLSSAKHFFQLLRIVNVHDRQFVFNVDLIHAARGARDRLFVDHLVIDDLPLLYRYQSIKIPMSALLFEEVASLPFQLQAITPAGCEVSVSFPLMSEIGILLTKSNSMSNPKRTRDAFDVFVSILQARDRAMLTDQILQNDIQGALRSLWQLVNNPVMRENISEYWSDAKNDETWANSSRTLENFFEESDIENTESVSDVRDPSQDHGRREDN